MKIDVNMDKLHETQVELLKEFDSVCRKYGIIYFLAYGTLLGAIRNGHVIPWDDDIDVVMLYDDYKKLLGLENVWKQSTFLQHNQSDEDYHKVYAKLRNSETTLIVDDVCQYDMNHGVAIDIYPLVNLADSDKDRKKQYIDAMAYMLLASNVPPKNHGAIMKIGSKIILSLPDAIKKLLLNYFEKKTFKHQMHETNECFAMCGNMVVMHRSLDNKWFLDTQEIAFEGFKALIPIGYKEWLIKCYGEDYITPLPENKRDIKLDHYIYIDLKHPYTDFKGIYYLNPNLQFSNTANEAVEESAKSEKELK